jgi:folate-dependent phosphoribosylglycinamide formyltransferase PurN
MRILIYTSEKMGSFNAYNISRLVSDRPDHRYKFVFVKRKVERISLIQKIKVFLVELRDGKNYWKRDLNELERTIHKKIKITSYTGFDIDYVEEVNDIRSIKIINDFNPDIILQAGAGILKKEIFSLSRIATLNVHHGYSPEIRGIKSTFWCLYYGLTDLIGVTCHIVDETLDTGGVIYQYRYNYSRNDSFIKIQEVLCEKGAELLVKSIDLFEKSSKPEMRKKEVNSYYFGDVDYRQYNELRKNGFLSVENPGKLKTKSKVKTYYADLENK